MCNPTMVIVLYQSFVITSTSVTTVYSLYDLTSLISVAVANALSNPSSVLCHLLEKRLLYVYNKMSMIWLLQYHTPYQPVTNVFP